MKNKINTTVILPIHDIGCENFNDLFIKAVKSVDNNTVLPTELLIISANETIKEYLEKNIPELEVSHRIIVNPNTSDYPTQVNYGVSQINTKYFSLLEFDDAYKPIWFENLEKYMIEYNDKEIFLPIISEMNSKGNFVGLSNEPAWSFDFSDKLGEINNETLLEFPNISLCGMTMDKEVFINIGELKPSIKLTFNYEFLLRYTYSGKNVLIIPKIGYEHTNMRPSSLFWEYKNSTDPNIKITPEESVFWMEVAKKEYYYTEAREINKEEQ